MVMSAMNPKLMPLLLQNATLPDGRRGEAGQGCMIQ